MVSSPLSKLHRMWHFARALDGFGRAQSRLGYLPTHLWIEPTNICNLQCIHCPTGLGLDREGGFIDMDLVESIIEQARDARPLIYFHLGGESLLHKQLPEIIRKARTAGMPTAMFTNAKVLDYRHAGPLIASGLEWLGFSFDGLDRTTYESIRRGGKFDKVLANIFKFLEMRSDFGSATPYTYMSIVDLAPDRTAEVQQEWDDLESRLLAAGLNHLEVTEPHTWAGLATEDDLSTLASPPARCPAPWSGLSILWDGTAVPCCLDIEGRMPVGDLNRQTLQEVWNGPEMQSLRKAFVSGQWGALPPACQDCHVSRQPQILGISRKAWIELKEELIGI